jgi:hypothetical protein
MRVMLLIAAVGGLALAAPALAQVEGEWAAAAETPQGAFEFGLTVAAADGGHTVAIADAPPPGAPAGAPAMESTISDVVVDGDKLTFKRSITTPQGPMELNYELTASGDTLSGTANSSFGAIPITGTRK